MKGLKKLVLASAIAAASSSSFAMQAMDEEAMSAATGQDGITISLTTDINIGKIRIHDKDGLNAVAGLTADFDNYFDGGDATTPVNTAGTTTNDASIVISGGAAAATAAAGNGVNALQGIAIKSNGTTSLVIDSGSQSGATPVLHITANLAATDIGLGNAKISVQSGNGSAAATAANSADILTFDAGTVLSLGATTLNIDLGNQPHNGDLIWGTSTLNAVTSATAWKNGSVLSLDSVNIKGGSGYIGVKQIALRANGGGSYSTDIAIGVNDATTPATEGLYINTSSTQGLDVALGDVTLGALTSASIGSVYIDNLRMNGGNTIYIKGH